MASTSSSTPRSTQAPPTVRKINDALYELYKPATSFIDVEIILFHGLQVRDYSDAYLKTWMLPDDSECWLNTWLAQEFPQARILSVTYDSSVHVSNSTGRLDMYTVGENLAQSLIRLEGIGQRCPVVLVGHCIGGLVLKQLCLQADQMGAMDMGPGPAHNPNKTFLGNMKRAFFYSTPNSGSRAMLSVKQRGPLLQYLELLSKDAARLNSSFAKLRQQHGWKTSGVGESNETEASRSVIRTTNLGSFYTSPGNNLRGRDKTASLHVYCPYTPSWLWRFVSLILLVIILQFHPSALETANVEIGIYLPPLLRFLSCDLRQCALSYAFPLISRFFNSLVQYSLEVEEGSARYDMDDFCVLSGEDNFSICKPRDRSSSNYQCLVKFVQEVLEIEEIVKYHWRSTLRMPSKFVDMSRRVERIIRALQSSSRLALVGMGGIGKTTLAKAVLVEIRANFHFICFVEDVKGQLKSQSKNLHALIAENLFLGTGKKVHPQDGNAESLLLLLLGKKVLLIMDDVDSEDQIRSLLSSNWLGKGSRVIITSRIRSRARMPTVEVSFLSEEESQDLFLNHLDADVIRRVPDDLVAMVVRMCEGLPLTLEVIGSYLRFEGDVRVWTSALHKLEKAESVDGSEDDRLWAKLRVSLDDLAKLELNLFLDIAVFDEEIDLETWRAAWETGSGGSSVDSELRNLVDRSLVKIKTVHHKSQTIFQMHQQLRDLGKSISTPPFDKIELCRRCWRQEDVLYLLNKYKGNEAHTEIISTVLDRITPPLTFQRSYLWSAIARLQELRLLRLSNVIMIGDESPRFPFKLRFLHLTSCFKDSDKKFNFLKSRCWPIREEDVEGLQQLSVLRLDSCSSVRLPSNFHKLSNLKVLIVQRTHLKDLPDKFGLLPALRVLILEDVSIPRLPSSFFQLSSLRSLTLEGCSLTSTKIRFVPRLAPRGGKDPRPLRSLTNLRLVDLPGVAELPRTFGMLESLECLEICGCSALKELPEGLSKLSNLHRLEIFGCRRLDSLSESFGELESLKELEIRYCPRLRRLPGSLGHLQSLDSLYLYDLGLQWLPETLGQLKSLTWLHISACDNLETLPVTLGQLKSLMGLTIWCPQLRSLPDSVGQLDSLQHLYLWECTNLEKLPDLVGQLGNLEVLYVGGVNLEVL